MQIPREQVVSAAAFPWFLSQYKGHLYASWYVVNRKKKTREKLAGHKPCLYEHFNVYVEF